MAMIQGIDGSALIQAFRAGRGDRYADYDRQRKLQQEDAEQQRQARVQGLMGQLFAGQQPTGVAAQMGAPAVPATFGEAFNPQTMEAFGRGESPAAPAAPVAPVAQAPARQFNPDALAQLIVLDPETSSKIASALKTMQETDLASLEAKNTALGAAAQWLSTNAGTEAERQQLLPTIIPHLLAAGWTEAEIAGKPLSDQALRGYMGQAMDMDTIIDNERAQREQDQGKIITPQPGEGAFRLNTDGTIDTLITPNSGGAPTGAADIPAEAIEGLRSGEGTAEDFDEIFGEGAAARVLGGPTGSAPSGPFQP